MVHVTNIYVFILQSVFEYFDLCDPHLNSLYYLSCSRVNGKGQDSIDLMLAWGVIIYLISVPIYIFYTFDKGLRTLLLFLSTLLVIGCLLRVIPGVADGTIKNEEDGYRGEYDPETCVVYSDDKSSVKNPQCVQAKEAMYYEKLAEGGWAPQLVTDGTVCTVHHCNATRRRGDPPGHLEFLGRQGQRIERVAEVQGCLSPEDFLKNYVYRHKPVVQRGCMKPTPRWTDAYLRSCADPEWETTQEFQKTVTRNDRGPFGKRLFTEFLEVYHAEERYMISPMEEETLRKDLRVPESMRCSRVVRSLEFTHLWMSSGASESSLHFDTEDNMMMMKGGTKQVWMIDPQDSRHVYMDYHDKYGLSPLNVRAIDLRVYPRVREATLYNVTISEGDQLYIPTHWWHQVNSGPETDKTQGNMAITINWDAWIEHSGRLAGLKPIPRVFNETMDEATQVMRVLGRMRSHPKIATMSAEALCGGRVKEGMHFGEVRFRQMDYSFWEHGSLSESEDFEETWLRPRIETYSERMLQMVCPFTMELRFHEEQRGWWVDFGGERPRLLTGQHYPEADVLVYFRSESDWRALLEAEGTASQQGFDEHWRQGRLLVQVTTNVPDYEYVDQVPHCMAILDRAYHLLKK